jgi:hypothetical protein
MVGNMEMDDDSFGKSPRVITGNPELDMMKAIVNMQETQEVHKIVN